MFTIPKLPMNPTKPISWEVVEDLHYVHYIYTAAGDVETPVSDDGVALNVDDLKAVIGPVCDLGIVRSGVVDPDGVDRDSIYYCKRIEAMMHVSETISFMGSKNSLNRYIRSKPHNFLQLVVKDGISNLAVSGELSNLKFDLLANCKSGLLTISFMTIKQNENDNKTVTINHDDIVIPVPEDVIGPVDNLVLECGQPHQASVASYMILREYTPSELEATRKSIESLFDIKPNSDAADHKFLKVEFSVGDKYCHVLVVCYKVGNKWYTWGTVVVNDFLCEVIERIDA